MAEQVPSSTAAPPQASPAAVAPPMLGFPGSHARWLLPIALCAGLLALALPVTVLIPFRSAANAEPDPTIHAVLADQLYLLNLRLWPLLLTAVLVGGAAAVSAARKNTRALSRLELRLRRIASGETDLPATDPARDFAQFDEVFAFLRAAIERTTKRNRTVLQQVQRPLRRLTQQLSTGEVPPEELRKTLSGVLAEIDVVLDAERRAAGKIRL